MNWSRLFIADWRRRPLRKSVTIAGVAVAVASLFSLLSFHEGYRDGMSREIDRLGAHVLVVPKGCPYDAASIALHGANWPCYLKSAYLEEVRNVPGIRAAAPALMSAFYSAEGAQKVFVGIDRTMLLLKPGWRIDGAFPDRDGEVLVGSDVARRHGWHVGETVSFAELDSVKGKVSGILQPTGGADDAFIYLRLSDAQRWLKHTNELTHILVRLNEANELDHAVTALRGCDAGMDMNVVPLAHLFRTIQTLVNSTRLLLGCVALIALCIAAAGVSNAVLMAVAERTREIGVLRALGASRGDIFRLFWLEALQLCFVGAVLGVIMAFVCSRGVESWLRTRLPFAPSDPLVQWQWWIAGVCVLGALVIGSVAGLLPATRAARRSPMEAMREGSRI